MVPPTFASLRRQAAVEADLLFFCSTAEMRSLSLMSPRCRVMYLSPFSIGFLLLFLSSDMFFPSFSLWFCRGQKSLSSGFSCKTLMDGEHNMASAAESHPTKTVHISIF